MTGLTRKAKRTGKITTNCPNLILRRRSRGNTTRQADWAIDMLFQGYSVKVKDHSLLTAESKRLFSIIIHRLESEHYLEKLLEKDLINIDYKKLSLCLKK